MRCDMLAGAVIRLCLLPKGRPGRIGSFEQSDFLGRRKLTAERLFHAIGINKHGMLE